MIVDHDVVSACFPSAGAHMDHPYVEDRALGRLSANPALDLNSQRQSSAGFTIQGQSSAGFAFASAIQRWIRVPDAIQRWICPRKPKFRTSNPALDLAKIQRWTVLDCGFSSAGRRWIA